MVCQVRIPRKDKAEINLPEVGLKVKVVDLVGILRRGPEMNKSKEAHVISTQPYFARPYLLALVFLSASGQKNSQYDRQVLKCMVLHPRRMEEDS